MEHTHSTNEKGAERVRVSVANLVQSLRIKETGQQYYFGILNPTKFRRGERQFQPLGGSAEVSLEAKQELEKLGAEFESGMDARFSLPASEFEGVYGKFSQENPAFFERDVERELREELSDEEIPGMPAILSKEEAKQIDVVYVGVTSQVPVSNQFDTSTNAVKIATRRLFHVFELLISEEMFEKLKRSEALHFYSDTEVAEIKRKGVAEVAYTEAGEIISNNTITTPFLSNL